MATLKSRTEKKKVQTKKARDAKEYDVMLFDFIEQELTIKKSNSEERLDEER